MVPSSWVHNDEQEVVRNTITKAIRMILLKIIVKMESMLFPNTNLNFTFVQSWELFSLSYRKVNSDIFTGMGFDTLMGHIRYIPLPGSLERLKPGGSTSPIKTLSGIHISWIYEITYGKNIDGWDPAHYRTHEGVFPVLLCSIGRNTFVRGPWRKR